MIFYNVSLSSMSLMLGVDPPDDIEERKNNRCVPFVSWFEKSAPD